MMRDTARRLVAPLVSGATYLRAVHLLLGFVLLLPYAGLIAMCVVVIRDGTGDRSVPLLLLMLAAFVIAFGIVLVPPVRALAIVAARGLLGVDLPEPSPAAAHDWAARRRTAAWYWLVLLLGSAVTIVVLYGIPTGVGLIAIPFEAEDATTTEALARLGWVVDSAGDRVLAVVGGVGSILVSLYATAAGGAVLVRVAPILLGPTPADRIAELHERERALATSNRLAREIHDSIGHALTAITMQAAAARRVLDSDREFARSALGHIENTGRGALDELDDVLAILRTGDDGRTGARTPDLTDVERLFEVAGADVDVQMSGDRTVVPRAVSREAYRVVQESLTNAVRHGAAAPIEVKIDVRQSEVGIVVTNRIRMPDRDTTEGRGLTGMRERVSLLGGRFRCEPNGADRWQSEAVIPWEDE